MSYDEQVVAALKALMDKHLKLASRYEGLGNCAGAAQLRNVANMLGEVLRTAWDVQPILRDAPDDKIRPRPDGFDAWWAAHEKESESLLTLSSHGLRDVAHECWCVGKHQLEVQHKQFAQQEYLRGFDEGIME